MLISIQNKQLTLEEVTTFLRQLLNHCHIDSSHFAVTALLEVTLSDNRYAYIGGVNVENDEHNRLSMHAEQNAAAIAQTLFSNELNISKIWVMGAAEEVTFTDITQQHVDGNTLVPACGHCRQILAGLAAPDVSIQSISVNGTLGDTHALHTLLPLRFSEKELNIPTINTTSYHNNNLSEYQPADLVKQATHLTKDDIVKYFHALHPRIIHSQYKTSATTACIVKVAGTTQYFPGVLVQNDAFLTTDPLFAAVGHTIATLGAKQLTLDEIHLYSPTEQEPKLSLAEIGVIARFATPEQKIFSYTATGIVKTYLATDYIKTTFNRLLCYYTATPEIVV